MLIAKHKKKMVFFLASCSICLSLCACTKSEKTDSPLMGTWKLNGSYDFSTGVIMDASNWRFKGDSTTATLQFSEDRTYKLVYSQYGKNEKTYTGTYEFDESSYYLTLNNDDTEPLTIMYYEDFATFDKKHDSFILITTEEKPENGEENRYFYLLKKYER